ncbi:Biotin-lipoyl like [Peptoclostridium litorale DSM 5388]|uniref:RND family efflux transporter, MFP subunit n=1 Tax=Peptoclostridium litorale DSM 5388 TaxID=1121324 RepID=A0A069RHP4_PEPLI|nr:biotin/lipoyl-binding protein [Peptoclostridium litorale]KDR95650.1 RND family efflux transporter, MFP subunit [Peptoclostridium litorale DSM 5388]SIO00264.1 Biotin-lipoyl like [Peptoclostridium litorale DSM 5388]
MIGNGRILMLGMSAILLFTGCTANEYPKAEYKKEEGKPAYIMAGRVSSTADSDISTKISGKVAKVFVKEGDTVEKGTPLLRLETAELYAQLAQAQAGVALAQANYEKMKTGARPEQKVQAQAALDNAKKSKEIAEANYYRNNELYKSGALSKQQLEAVEVQLQAAVSQETSASAQVELLRGESGENLKIAQLQVAQAQAVLESVKAQVDNGVIAAPYEGTIVGSYVEAGELASPGIKLFTIQGVGSLKIEGLYWAKLKRETRSL